MKAYQFWGTRFGNPTMLGCIGLDGTKIILGPELGQKVLFDSIVQNSALGVDPNTPVEWFNRLGKQYHGSYLKAELVEVDSVKPSTSINVYKNDKEVGKITVNPDPEIETQDGALEDLFYELVDEDIPDGDRLVPFSLDTFGQLIEIMNQYGYEVRA